MMRLAVLALGLVAFGAGAEPAGLEFRPFAAHENLDNGYQDWREAGAEFAWRQEGGRLLLARVRETERYGLRDREAAALVSWQPGGQWTLTVEATGASDAQVLPEWSANLVMARAFDGGWVASGTAKQTRYATADVTMFTAGLERYVGAWRLAYTAYLSRPEGAAWSPTHRVTASWYGDGLTRLEAGFARGRETENTPLGIVTSAVRNATLSGALALTPTAALTVDLERQRQGDFYTRKTVRLGARLFF